MKFQRNDLIKHSKSGVQYMVLLTPADGLFIERGAEPAYAYQRIFTHEDARIWVRPSHEMEDGRFEFVMSTTHGASGRLPG